MPDRAAAGRRSRDAASRASAAPPCSSTAGRVEFGQRRRNQVDVKHLPVGCRPAAEIDAAQPAILDLGDDGAGSIVECYVGRGRSDPGPGQAQPGAARRSAKRRRQPGAAEPPRQKAAARLLAAMPGEEPEQSLQCAVEQCWMQQIIVERLADRARVERYDGAVRAVDRDVIDGPEPARRNRARRAPPAGRGLRRRCARPPARTDQAGDRPSGNRPSAGPAARRWPPRSGRPRAPSAARSTTGRGSPPPSRHRRRRSPCAARASPRLRTAAAGAFRRRTPPAPPPRASASVRPQMRFRGSPRPGIRRCLRPRDRRSMAALARPDGSANARAGRAGGNRAADDRRAGSPDHWLRPSCRTSNAGAATGITAGRAGRPGRRTPVRRPDRSRRHSSAPRSPETDRRRRRCATGWRRRSPRPPPRAARPTDRNGGSRWGRFRQRCDSPRRSARRSPSAKRTGLRMLRHQ